MLILNQKVECTSLKRTLYALCTDRIAQPSPLGVKTFFPGLNETRTLLTVLDFFAPLSPAALHWFTVFCRDPIIIT